MAAGEGAVADELGSAASGVRGGASPTGDWRDVTMTAITVAMPLATTMATRGARTPPRGGTGRSTAASERATSQALHERHLRAPSTTGAPHEGHGTRCSLIG